MSALTSFTFNETLSVRIQNFDGISWFVAKDIALCLEYSVSAIAGIAKLFSNVPDKWKQIKPFETRGGIQNLLAVTEQGLYRFLMRSDKPKAIPFQDWLADDVIPAIRKQGFYSAQEQDNSLITPEQQYEISSHVMRKTHALFGQRNYSAVYRALKRRFRIPRYTCLLSRDYQTALNFIDSLTKEDFNLPDVEEEKTQPLPSKRIFEIQYTGFTICSGSTQTDDIPAIPASKTFTITEQELKAIKAFVYFFDELFKPLIQWAGHEAFKQKHPQASRFYDVWHEPLWFLGRMKSIIERNS